MKKGVIVLVLILIISCFSGISPSALSEHFNIEEEIEMADGSAVTSVTAWNNYLFASTAKGLKIYDINTRELVATWKFTNTDIPAVGNQFTPVFATVSDDYIVVLSATNFVAVFPNEGVFTDKVPTIIRRLGLFGNQPRMFIEGDFLYAVDMTASTTIKNSASGAYTYPAKSIVVWKIDLSNAENFPYSGNKTYKYSLLNVPAMYQNGYAELTYVCAADNYWGSVEIKDNRMYFVTFNDTETAPYKTLTLHSVSLENISDVNSLNVYQDAPEGLIVTFDTTTSDVDELKALYIYETDNSDNKVQISEFGRNVQVTTQSYTDGSFSATFYFTTISDFESKFGVSASDIKNKSVTFSIGYGEESYTLEYNENSKSFGGGALAATGDYLYLMTGKGASTANVARGNDYIYLVDISDSSDIFIEDYATMPQLPNAGNWYISATQSAVAVGNTLLCFVKECNYHAGAIDITSAPELTYNFAESVGISGNINTNDLSRAILYGGNVYYPSNKKIGIIKTSASNNSFGVGEEISSFPIKAGGEAAAKTVGISVGDIFAEADAQNGAYGILVSSLPNGEYTISANTGAELFEKTITVDVPDAIVFSELAAETDVRFKVVNNTDKYLNKTESIKFVAVSYDSNGNYIDNKEVTKTCKYGKSVSVTMTLPTTEDGGFIMVYATNSGALLDAPVKISGEKAERAAKINVKKEITANVSVNEADKIVTVTGTYISGSDLLAETKKDDIETVDIRHLRVAADGSFSYTYSYKDDIISNSSLYKLSLTDADATKEVELTLKDEENFNVAMATLKGSVSSAEALVSYFGANPSVAAALGIDVSDEDYAALSSEGKAKVMTPVYEKITNSDYSGIKNVFESKTTEIKAEEDKKNALSEIKAATTSTLYGVLEKYKSIYGISDTLWTNYKTIAENDKKLTKVNTYFVKKQKTITELSKVSDFLKKAIESLNAPESSSDGDSVTSSNYGGKYESKNEQASILPIVTPSDDMFLDVSSGHWAKSCIEELAKEGVLSGIGGGMFAPDDYITREQMAKILTEAFGFYKADATASFADIDINAWYYPYVASAAEAGIVFGDGESFGVGSYITRQDAAVMLLRAAEMLNVNISGDKVLFADDGEISDYAKEAVYKMQGAGVINGSDANKFAPKEPLTRAMAAKMVYELKKACAR